MKQCGNKKEINNMESMRVNDIIEFEDYAPLDKDYTKKELAEIYKRIITDIEARKK